MDLDGAFEHPMLTPAQRRGAAMAVGPGRAVVEALLALGFSPRSLKTWRELFSYIDMHGVGGLNELVECVRRRGGHSPGSYAAILVGQGMDVGSQCR